MLKAHYGNTDYSGLEQGQTEDKKIPVRGGVVGFSKKGWGSENGVGITDLKDSRKKGENLVTDWMGKVKENEESTMSLR